MRVYIIHLFGSEVHTISFFPPFHIFCVEDHIGCVVWQGQSAESGGCVTSNGLCVLEQPAPFPPIPRLVAEVHGAHA